MLRISALVGRERVDIDVKPIDQDGNAAEIEAGSLVGASTGAGTASVDATTARIMCISDDVGQQVIVVSADADLGVDVETISDSVTIDWIHPKATALGLSVTKEPRP